MKSPARRDISHVRLLLFIAIVFVLLVAACVPGSVRGSGNVVAEHREVTAFTGFDILERGTVELRVGLENSLTVQAEANILPLLETDIRDGILVLGQSTTNIQPTRPIRYLVTVRELDFIRARGSSRVEAMSPIAVDQLTIQSLGASRITIEQLDANTLTTEVAGSGSVTLGGTTTEQNITLGGPGRYIARELTSIRATVLLTGAGNITINVSDQLDATVSGSGNINYVGEPTVTSNVSGAGRIRRFGG